MTGHLGDYFEETGQAPKDYLQEYLERESPVINTDYRTLQRSALGAMIQMRPEMLDPVVSQVETQYQNAIKETQAKYQEAGRDKEAEFQDNLQKRTRDHQERIDKIASAYESDLSELETQTQSRRDSILSNSEAHLQEAQKNHDYEVMLAETVADGATKKCEQERRDIETAVPAGKQRLDTIEKHAELILNRYRWPIPALQPDTEPTPAEMHDPVRTFRQKQERANQYILEFESLKTPKLFIGARPYIIAVCVCGIMAGFMWMITFLNLLTLPSFLITGPVTIVIMLALMLVTARILWRRGREQIKNIYEPFKQEIIATHKVLERHLELTLAELKQREQEIQDKRAREITGAGENYETIKANTAKRRETTLENIEQEYQTARASLDERRINELKQAEQHYQGEQDKLRGDHDRWLKAINEKHRQETSEIQKKYQSAQERLRSRWQESLTCIDALCQANTRLDPCLHTDWDDRAWQDWSPPKAAISNIRLGRFDVTMSQLADCVFEQGQFGFDRNQSLSLPAVLAFPDRCSLLVQSARTGREKAVDILKAVMTRLFTSLPPGRVRFTIVDPVGLGENFAGFMHAADYEESLVGGRIWTDAGQIQQRLVDLTEHMENVIQKYLRNEFETIEDYNLQAGELAEPYRFLVIADFPTNFNEESIHRLSSIIHSGSRCGVYTLIMLDERQSLPGGIDIEDIAAKSVHLVYEDDHFVWQDEVFGEFGLRLDKAPSEDILTRIMHTVGRAGQDSTRVEVPFETIAPPDEKIWSRDSSAELMIPLGRTGATRLQYLRLGKGVAQHMLIAGKTGSGKSTLLHVIILNLSLWYAPDEIELYLIDFKRGVEFKTYVTNKLSHTRTVAIESDREFGLSVLQRLDDEMARRGELFRQAGVQDIAGYRRLTGKMLARNVLIVDEFQVFFSDDDKLAQDAALLLEQLVRQGRAFGIHVLLGSQTLGGASGLAQSTIGQMAVRIALQCSEIDSQLILNEDNVAGRLLSRPGEAIYNDAGGLVVGNSPFQTAWLPDAVRDKYLARLAELGRERGKEPGRMIVFEGNVPADITTNRLLGVCLEPGDRDQKHSVPTIWLGDPVAIKDPTAVSFRRQSGANLMITGQRDETARSLMSAAIASLAVQHDARSIKCVILDGSPADSAHAGILPDVARALCHNPEIVEWREVAEVIAKLTEETQRRLQAELLNEPPVFLMIYGLQRYRVLRRNEDEFGFSMEQNDTPRPDRQLVEILREGPAVGIHTIIWADTLSTFERTFERQMLREFDFRVLFQMSAADSSNLIDTPIANQLGFHRALFYSEEHGQIEKFRPYAPLNPTWL
ncbi:MAG: DUF87 domain-containing protein, partial [Sedimentisphaerales bacterium]|nr:DUF87 domain-containing protein [Sedimentisphaerales bacterium]